jgi:spermidine/putrescine transport system substrate-binding protein
MSLHSLIERIASGRASRRDIHCAFAATGLGLASVPMFGGQALAEGEVTYFTWAGYDIPELMPAYVEQHGGMPATSLFGEDEEAFAKVRGGYRPDVAHPCKVTLGRFRDGGLIKPMDPERIPAWSDVWTELKGADGIETAEGIWQVPFDWGNASVLYRTDLVDPSYNENPTWEILWDERYDKRLATFDSVDGAVLVAGLVAGAEDIFHMTDAELARARELLEQQRELLLYYWTDQTAAEQALASGELVASYAWNNAVVNLKQQGLPVEYMTPREGIFTWFCGFVMIVDGPGDEGAAYDLINAMLEPEVGAWLIDNYGFGHANSKAVDLVAPARLDELGIGSPEALFADGIFFAEIDPDVRERYITVFEEVKAGF